MFFLKSETMLYQQCRALAAVWECMGPTGGQLCIAYSLLETVLLMSNALFCATLHCRELHCMVLHSTVLESVFMQ